jgi:hypothetical protein
MFGSYFWSDMYMSEKCIFSIGKLHVGLMATLDFKPKSSYYNSYKMTNLETLLINVWLLFLE